MLPPTLSIAAPIVGLCCSSGQILESSGGRLFREEGMASATRSAVQGAAKTTDGSSSQTFVCLREAKPVHAVTMRGTKRPTSVGDQCDLP
ncbi:hypothetical protein F5Y10DRAFT_265298 [Nemania abortiva]|nr:hypothetical protein F5Y10DRAFT_265298 [Nemania abortiva]